MKRTHTTSRRLSRSRRTAARSARGGGRGQSKEGFALFLSLIAVTILAVLVSDLHETSTMGLTASVAQRDQLRAEMLAKSGINLTRMLIGQERNLRRLADPFYMMLGLGGRAPPIPIWQYADMILGPFSDFEGSQETFADSGFDFSASEGLGKTGGTFSVTGVAENSKINVADPIYGDPSQARSRVAQQLYSLMGGLMPSPNKYDPLFSQFDEKGRLTTRLDVVANVIDWWDADEQRTQYDPALALCTSAGGEDTDYYRNLRDPYVIKNAAFDTVDELRLVRGFNDDFWATFVEPDPEDPRTRQLTIYGGGAVNPNEAEPQVLLARVCSFVSLKTQLLCNDVSQMAKFIVLLQTARSMAPIPWFGRATDFVNFITGSDQGLYGKLKQFLTTSGKAEQMLFTPLTISPDDKTTVADMRKAFTTRSSIVSLYATAKVGHAQKRIRAVINTDARWVPPPPNTGKLPPLGVFHYYRID